MTNLRLPAAFTAGLAGALAAGWLLLPVLLYEKVEQPLSFSHAAHGAEGAGLSCEDCHPLRGDGRFAGVPAVETCAACHAEPIGETAGERRLVTEYIAAGREIPWLVYARQPDNVWFPHGVHLKLAELPCARCHGPHGGTTELRPFERNRISGYSRDIWGASMSRLRPGPAPGAKMGDCSGCHFQRGVEESCLDCHR